MSTFLLETVRILVSGIVAAIAWAAGLAIAFGPAQRFLTDPERQSAKFLSVFTEEPLPRAAENPEVMVYGLLVVGLIHACVYAWLDSRLSGGVVRKGLSFGLIAWALMVPWFEFYLPWNVMHEPLSLVLLEGFCWLIVLIGVGLSLASVYGILSRVAKPSSA
jgi:hypothetical protein